MFPLNTLRILQQSHKRFLRVCLYIFLIKHQVEKREIAGFQGIQLKWFFPFFLILTIANNFFKTKHR